MRIPIALVVAVLLAVGACGGDDPPEAAPTPRATTPDGNGSPGPTFLPAAALIDTEGGSVLVRVEVAQDDDARQRGLMFRESLAEDHGMVFIYFEEHTGGFWMKNTLIPLSIAFFDAEGTIVRILDMDPCTEDPCEVYEPGAPYTGALEVNQGMFEEWGVTEGDRITLTF